MADQNSTAGATPTAGQSSPLIPNLPDDISLQCIARIPRPYHSSLSAVSKSWRSTLRSPEFFKTRSLLRSTQQSLCLTIRVDSSIKGHLNTTIKWYLNTSDKSWYLLNQNPNPKFLSPLPLLKSQPFGAAYVVLGPKIYVIGGSHNRIPSKNVSILDCRLGTWKIGPEMRVAREFPAAGVVNGKIYVIGGNVGPKFLSSMNSYEVYDPVTGVWTTISSRVEVMNKWMCASVVNGRIYAMTMNGCGGVVYNAVTGEWSSSLPERLDLVWNRQNAVVDGIMYFYVGKIIGGKIIGYNVELDVWNDLKGNFPNFLGSVIMVSLNGNLCAVWGKRGSMNKEVEIMCTEIKVWKDDDGGGLSGSVLWSDMIHSVPRGFVLECLSVEL